MLSWLNPYYYYYYLFTYFLLKCINRYCRCRSMRTSFYYCYYYLFCVCFLGVRRSYTTRYLLNLSLLSFYLLTFAKFLFLKILPIHYSGSVPIFHIRFSYTIKYLYYVCRDIAFTRSGYTGSGLRVYPPKILN